MSIIRNISVFIIIFFITNNSCNNKTLPGKHFNTTGKRGEYRIMFYNVENFFDTYNDSLTHDDEFLPEGNRHWNTKRFNDKLNKLYKVIIAVGGWEAPEIIGLCEIENKYVLNRLIYDTPLSKFNYGIVHRDSPDIRGIDVALLYRRDKVRLLKEDFHNISFPWDPVKKTRDILYFKGLAGKDTLHIFINHWPSRYGGQPETEAYRLYTSSVLRKNVDSIFNINKKSKLVITGSHGKEIL